MGTRSQEIESYESYRRICEKYGDNSPEAKRLLKVVERDIDRNAKKMQSFSKPVIMFCLRD